MRILITGGFGFLGGRLAVHLALAGHQIVIGSRNVSPPPVWLPQAEVLQMVWSDKKSLEKCCNGIDVVIQAAGINAQDCIADPVYALEINGVATARLTEVASLAGVKRFIYISTAHVYASPLEGTITEESCTRNLHPYATSHLAGELALLGACKRGQIDGLVLRLSNAFGAPTHKEVKCWTLLVNDLCKQAVQTGKMVLQTNGLQHRDFISMANVCRTVEHVINYEGNLTSYGICNVGVGTSLSVLEMSQYIQKRCERVIGLEPTLLTLNRGDHKNNHLLEYRTDRLDKMGVKLSIENSVEIDKLLVFCQLSFG
jgi:UDP-glucose 4-epimerase